VTVGGIRLPGSFLRIVSVGEEEVAPTTSTPLEMPASSEKTASEWPSIVSSNLTGMSGA
jgi:hypothetical protein